MLHDGLVFKDEAGQVIFNQYSFCELVKHLLVELVGIRDDNSALVLILPYATAEYRNNEKSLHG